MSDCGRFFVGGGSLEEEGMGEGEVLAGVLPCATKVRLTPVSWPEFLRPFWKEALLPSR